MTWPRWLFNKSVYLPCHFCYTPPLLQGVPGRKHNLSEAQLLQSLLQDSDKLRSFYLRKLGHSPGVNPRVHRFELDRDAQLYIL
jgi:hypothetical protein